MARIMKKIVNVEEMSVRFEFNNGETFVAYAENYPEHIRKRDELHGMCQKLGDKCAGKDDSEWLDIIRAEDAKLQNGDWGAVRGSGLEDKLEEAEERLEKYIALTDEQKTLMAGMGVSRSAIEKEITQIKKAIKRRDEKN